MAVATQLQLESLPEGSSHFCDELSTTAAAAYFYLCCSAYCRLLVTLWSLVGSTATVTLYANRIKDPNFAVVDLAEWIAVDSVTDAGAGDADVYEFDAMPRYLLLAWDAGGAAVGRGFNIIAHAIEQGIG